MERQERSKVKKQKPRRVPYFPTPTVGMGETVDLPFKAEWLPDYVTRVDQYTAANMLANREFLEGLNARLAEVQPFDTENLQPLVLGGVELGRQFVESEVLVPNEPVVLVAAD